MSTVDRLVHKTNVLSSFNQDTLWFSSNQLFPIHDLMVVILFVKEKIDSATDVLKSILKHVVDEDEEITWPPRDPQALTLMEEASSSLLHLLLLWILIYFCTVLTNYLCPSFHVLCMYSIFDAQSAWGLTVPISLSFPVLHHIRNDILKLYMMMKLYIVRDCSLSYFLQRWF